MNLLSSSRSSFRLDGAAEPGAGLMAAARGCGDPKPPLPLDRLSQAFRSVDLSDLPPARHYTARNGDALAYHHHAHAGEQACGSVVLVHGWSARGASMHPLASRLAEAGWDAYALDVRGHGASGRRGQVDYVGQLEDDVEDFMLAVQPAGPRVMLGFSSGGGFALRLASEARQTLFDRYLLLAPFLGLDAPTHRRESVRWMSHGRPREVALNLLNQLGITELNHLIVLRFALDDAASAILTPAYGYGLATNFQPRRDWRADLNAVRRPMQVIVGDDDEMCDGHQIEDVFGELLRPVPVRRVAGLGHLGTTLEWGGHAAVLRALATPP